MYPNKIIRFIDGKTKLETSTVDHEANDGVTEELSGYLDKACGEDDGMFDLILKVNNAFQMSWIFNAQALQTQTRMVMKTLKVNVTLKSSRKFSGLILCNYTIYGSKQTIHYLIWYNHMDTRSLWNN